MKCGEGICYHETGEYYKLPMPDGSPDFCIKRQCKNITTNHFWFGNQLIYECSDDNHNWETELEMWQRAAIRGKQHLTRTWELAREVQSLKERINSIRVALGLDEKTDL